MTRRLLFACVAVVALLTAAFLTSRFVFSDPEVAPAPIPSAEPETSSARPAPLPNRVVIERAVGLVETRVAGKNAWTPLASGDELPVDAIVRTGEGASVSLRFRGARVDVDEKTQLSLPQLAEAYGLRLGEGRIAANVPVDGGVFRVEVEGNDTVARSAGGEFSVLAVKDEQTTVAATKGEVELSAKDEKVTIREGHVSTVYANEPPSEPRAIPASLFLKVKSPSGTVRRRQYELAGFTTPGAIISVNGVKLRVSRDGQFTKMVDLAEGPNVLEVVSDDALGRTSSAKVEVTADTKPPPLGGEMTWGK